MIGLARTAALEATRAERTCGVELNRISCELTHSRDEWSEQLDAQIYLVDVVEEGDFG